MTDTLAFDHLLKGLHQQLASLSDYRKGKNTRYAIKDAVAPGRREVITLAPEFITPPDGHAKQDCEQVAAKR